MAVQLQQFKVLTAADGTVSLGDATAVRPGDVIEYRAIYRNRSNAAVSGLVATLPVPVGMRYLPATARPAGPGVEAATSDGAYAAEPLMRKAVQADGSHRLVPVPLIEYRSLRWKLGPLPAGAVLQVQARAQVVPLDVAPSAAASSAAAPDNASPAAPRAAGRP